MGSPSRPLLGSMTGVRHLGSTDLGGDGVTHRQRAVRRRVDERAELHAARRAGVPLSVALRAGTRVWLKRFPSTRDSRA